MNQYLSLTIHSLPILIVDDSTSYRLLLMRHIKAWGNYTILQAEDGQQALEILRTTQVGIVISDWEMPNINGVELCKEVRKLSGSYVYFILVTSRATADDLVLGMDAGADDFLIKPINQQELRVRLRAGERILSLEAGLEEKNQRLNAAYKLIEDDLKAAAQMQRSLLPQGSLNVPQLSCDWFFQPSLFVSGDMLNFFRLDQEHIGFYSVDVSGHGVKSAMLSVTISSLLNQHNLNGIIKKKKNDKPFYAITTPKEVVSQLNKQFQLTIDGMIYFTMVYGILNIVTGQGKLTRAGHPHPLIIHDDGQIEIIESGDVPIGFLPDAEYHDIEFCLGKNSRLYLYTDGISECENEHKQAFGEQQLMNFLVAKQKSSLNSSIEELQQLLQCWRDKTQKGFADDMSLLAIHFDGIVI